jgi:hypothetical protein
MGVNLRYAQRDADGEVARQRALAGPSLNRAETVRSSLIADVDEAAPISLWPVAQESGALLRASSLSVAPVSLRLKARNALFFESNLPICEFGERQQVSLACI